jgi:DNA-binding NtrC family response regulator
MTKRRYEGAQRRIACQKSSLVIEEDDQVLGLMLRWLKAMDFAVTTASVADEALPLYIKRGPFDVVILSHLHRVDGGKIASEIRKMNASQGIILATTYSVDECGDPSPEIPILFKPFRKSQFQALIQSCANTAENNPAPCFRPKKRRGRTSRTKTSRPIRSSRCQTHDFL